MSEREFEAKFRCNLSCIGIYLNSNEKKTEIYLVAENIARSGIYIYMYGTLRTNDLFKNKSANDHVEIEAFFFISQLLLYY